ncbi:MAG: FG-GAP-like repeat-containing protein [Bacteroidota bacterium]
MKIYIKAIIFTLLFSQFLSCKNDPNLFKSLPAEDTGITFSNRITENDTMNILDFEYIYNGGGVGFGDFNSDGLQDVYFTGNQVANKLYLNRTDTTEEKSSGASIRFEDITEKSKVTGNGKWCSGVAVADVNADGKLDIYVCANVKKSAKDRENLLYINKGIDKNGVPIFDEMAKEFGLNDTTFSTNAAFFDYDNDGDLDAYILVDKIDNKTSPTNFHNKTQDGTAPNNDQLYRNDFDPQLGHAVFTNITKQAGITQEGFGLGLNVTDINRDGWKDVFVTNDFITNDLLWINNKNGTFTDQAAQYFKHTSSSAMGNDIADLNNDGLADIYCLDMLPEDNYRKKMLMMPNNYLTYQNNEQYGFQYQYVRNTLQLNQGKKPNTDQQIFSEISLLANVAETDWSWCPLLMDFDNDGFRDIIVTNGFPKDVTDHDFITFKNESGSVAGSEYLLDLIPEVKIKNYAFRNKGNLTFENVTNHWGIEQPSFSNGAAYADLDNDGDMDYMVNNINDSAFVYQNQLVQKKGKDSNYLKIKFKGDGLNTQGLGTIVELSLKNGQKMVYENSPFRGYLSTVEAVAHFGLGATNQVDEVKIIWQNGKEQVLKNVAVNQTILADASKAGIHQESELSPNNGLFSDITDSLGINYVHSELDFIDFNYQKLLPHKFSQYGPSLAVGDVNGDGLEDVYIGGSNYRKGKFLIQNKAGKFEQKDLLPGTDTLKTEEEASSLLIDVDNDNDLDLYIVSGGSEFPKSSSNYQDRLFINEKGSGSLPQFVQNKTALPTISKSGSCVRASDFDKDGDLDLFIGGRLIPENYPKVTSSYLLRNDSPKVPSGGLSAVKFTDITKLIAPELLNIGLVCDALFTDFDNDGWLDLALAGEWMPIKFLKNNKGKSFSAIKTDLDMQSGWWNSLAGGDFDNDGDIDYLAGNLGLNSINRANDLAPLKIYGKDFNNDGLYDAIPTTFFPDEMGNKQEYPYHVREDMIKQLITTRAKYPDFASYGKAKITDMFSPEELKGSDLYQANYLASSYIENLGTGKFKMSQLPTLAQTAPIFGINVEDVNNDGLLDAVFLGNDYGTELTNGRYDAMNGMILKNRGKDGFEVINSSESKFYVPGNAKALVKINSANGQGLLMASQNRGKLLAFRPQFDSKIGVVNKNDSYALLTTKDGKTRKVELYFGQSFYSSGSRNLSVSDQIIKAVIVDNQGVKRDITLK